MAKKPNKTRDIIAAAKAAATKMNAPKPNKVGEETTSDTISGTTTDSSNLADTMVGDEGQDSVIGQETIGDIISDEDETSEDTSSEDERTGPSAFMRYAQRHHSYEGNDEDTAWHIFCVNCDGMMKFVNMAPSLALLTADQMAYLESFPSE